MEKALMSRLLLIVSVLLAAGSATTLIPYPGAGETNIMGYKSLCSFAPVSTLIMLFAANTLNGIRKKKFKV